MTRAFCRFAVLSLAAAMAPMTPATQVSAKHARVELLSRQKTAVPGADMMLGVRFMLEKGWHIYWANPGDSGQPPVFKWQMPEGFSAGEIQWPLPERMQSSPMLADYGYHDDVLLLVPVKVSRGAATGETAQINLDAKWLICREVCLPDRAQFELALPVSREAQMNSANVELFSRTQKLLPRTLPKGWKATVLSHKNEFVLTIHAGKRLGKAEFFPLDAAQIDNAAAQKLEPLAKGARIVLKKSDLLTKPVSKLRGVLAISRDRAYAVEAPVTSAGAVQ